MKLLVCSDIHGSKYFANKLKLAIIRQNPDKIIVLGDIYYHGPRNPLPKEYDPMAVCEILNSFGNKITCTKGNCDAEVDEMISKFPFKENVRMIVGGVKYMFTHGHKFNMDNIPSNIDVLVYGHFHTGFIKEKDGVFCVNSGSVSIPKDNTLNSYLVIEDKTITLLDLDGNVIETKIIK